MGLVLLTLCLLVESAASGLLDHETDCGKYHVSNSNDPSRQLFYINGKLVERYLFCKAMRNHHERQCFVQDNIRNKYCQSLGTSNISLYQLIHIIFVGFQEKTEISVLIT